MPCELQGCGDPCEQVADVLRFLPTRGSCHAGTKLGKATKPPARLMKQFLKVAAMAAFVLLSSCSKTPEQKAEALISEYMQNNLKDPASYECIKQGNLGKVTPMSTALELIEKGCKEHGYPNDSINPMLARFKAMQEQQGKDPYEHLGYTLTLKYRAKNSFGGYEIQESEFIFNKELTAIEAVK